jgi:hypothetical protein
VLVEIKLDISKGNLVDLSLLISLSLSLSCLSHLHFYLSLPSSIFMLVFDGERDSSFRYFAHGSSSDGSSDWFQASVPLVLTRHLYAPSRRIPLLRHEGSRKPRRLENERLDRNLDIRPCEVPAGQRFAFGTLNGGSAEGHSPSVFEETLLCVTWDASRRNCRLQLFSQIPKRFKTKLSNLLRCQVFFRSRKCAYKPKERARTGTSRSQQERESAWWTNKTLYRG